MQLKYFGPALEAKCVEMETRKLTNTRVSDHHLAVLKVLFAATLWGLSGTAAQILFHDYHLFTTWVLAIRTEFGGGLLLAYLIVKRGSSELVKIVTDPRALMEVALFGTVALGGVQFAYFMAVAKGDAVSATLLQYAAPLLLFVWGVTVHRRFRTLRSLVTSAVILLLALVGTISVLTNGSFSTLIIPVPGVIWGLISAVAAALYMNAPTSLLQRYDSAYIVAIGLSCAGLVLSPFWIVSSPTKTVTMTVILLLLFIVIFGTSISFALFINSLKTLPPFEASVISCAEPIAASAANVLFLGFPLHLVAIIGGMLTMSSVVVISSQTTRSQRRPSQDPLQEPLA
jgi:drug/metabolite transporter (DMT)-like permease